MSCCHTETLARQKGASRHLFGISVPLWSMEAEAVKTGFEPQARFVVGDHSKTQRQVSGFESFKATTSWMVQFRSNSLPVEPDTSSQSKRRQSVARLSLTSEMAVAQKSGTKMAPW